MSNAYTSGLKRFVFWDYARATWQYDVMVAIILAFIFLTPREKFGDQPRIPRASNIAMLPAEHGSSMYWIDPELLRKYEPQVKTGLPGVAYVRLDVKADWPVTLQVKLPQ